MSRILAQIDRRISSSIVGISAAVFAVFQWFFILHMSFCQSIDFFRSRGFVKEFCGLSKDCSVQDQIRITQAAQMQIWVLITIAGAALAGAISAWCLLAIVNLWKTGDAQDRVRRIASIVWRFLVFSAILWLISPISEKPDLGCYGNYIRVKGAGGVLFLAIGFVMAAIWAVEMRIGSPEPEATKVKMLLHFIELRGRMQSLFTMASILLVGGIIHVAVRYSMEGALSKGNCTTSEEVLQEGLSYTILLACAYIPIHARFNRVGDQLLDSFSAEPESAESEKITLWATNRKSLEDLMNLRSYEWKSFGPGLAVMAPALAGFVSKIFESQFLGSR